MRSPRPRDQGYSLIECLLALVLVSAAASVVSPVGAAVVEGIRPRQAAGFLAAQFRLARQQAALTGAARGFVFDWSANRWLLRLCSDGNGNGVRRSELGEADACTAERVDLTELFPGVSIESDPSFPDPGGGPGSMDPVRFGASDVLTFSPAGSATAGTLYLQGARGDQYAVRVAGINGRIRVLFFDRQRSAWFEV